MTEPRRLALYDMLDRDAPPTAEEWAAYRARYLPLTVAADPNTWPPPMPGGGQTPSREEAPVKVTLTRGEAAMKIGTNWHTRTDRF